MVSPSGARTRFKQLGGAGGWREGLPLATEDWANGANGSERKRWTSTVWTQDDPSKSYSLNPRSIESRVGDTTNVKRTTVDYLMQPNSTTVSYFGLPNEQRVYDADRTTVLKTAKSFYNFGAAYLSRRIIGLPSGSELYDQNGALMSKMTYNYDEGNFSDTSLNQNLSNAVRHDNTNYGSSFIVGRANQTSVTRYDVLGQTANVTSTVKYNTTGATVAQSDPLGRTVKINYADSFNDSTGNRNTFAYPTTLTDPAGNSSTVIYRYDFGANVRAQSPAPAGNPTGKISTREYDALGRPIKESIVNTGAYTRYEYPANNIQSKVFSTITDTNNNGADTADEVLSESWTDGAGRVRKSRTELPNSAGGYAGQMAEYDILGQVKRQSVPTEVNSNWSPAGDDATRGFLWTSQEYDWKGRTTRTINTDGTDKLISYEGCGCAGGQVTTIKGEVITQTDANGTAQNLGRRTQRIYADILGRTYQTEILNWDDSVYTSVKTIFNGRDQAVSTTQYQGAAEGNTAPALTTTLTYDGHGRLKTAHRPEMDANAAAATNYRADDSIESVVDARGASANYIYNNRGSVTQIGYAVPTGSAIAVPSNINFTYDNLGNRTQMTDALGSTTYSYDQISRLTSETRTINDAAIGFNQSFTFNYGYSLSGQLTNFSDPNDAQRNLTYTLDKLGRTTALAGNGFYNVTDYAHDLKYRAFGELKQMSYGSGKLLTQSFNNRLQLQQFDINGTLGSTNEYYADGRVKKTTDGYDNRFDRLFKYDQAGRITEAKTGLEARNEAQPYADGPFRQTYSYDAFGGLTGRTGKVWSVESDPMTAIYAGGRDITAAYDADGRQTASGNLTNFYDAVGRRNQTDLLRYNPVNGNPYHIITGQTFDGDGRRIRQGGTYYVNSSILGVMYDVYKDTNGQVRKNVGIVYLNGQKLAFQNQDGVAWNYQNPVTGSQRGAGISEPDPFGADAGLAPPAEGPENDPNTSDLILNSRFGSILNLFTGCTSSGMPISCSIKEFADGAEQEYWRIRGQIQTNRDRRQNQPGPLTANAAHESGHTAAAYSTTSSFVVNTTSIANAMASSNADDTIYGTANGVSYVTVRGSLFDDDVKDGQTQVGVNVELSKKDKEKISKAIERVKTFKPSDDCQKNVIDKLSKLGFKLEDFQKYLEKGFNVYDIAKSTVSVVGSLFNQIEAKGYNLTSADTISETYKDTKTPEGNISRTNAVTSISSATFLSYIRPDALGNDNRNRAFMFHEGLHGFLSSIGGKGYTDSDLKSAFSLKETDNTDDITKHIKENCFKK